MNPPRDFDNEESQEAHEDRVRLLKTANKLTISFAVWAVVVGLIGAAAIFVLSEIWNEQKAHEQQARAIEADVRRDIATLNNQIAVIKDRQDNVIRRLERLEDER